MIIHKQRFRQIQLNKSSNQAKGLVLWYPLCSMESAAQSRIDYSGKGSNLTTNWSATQNSLSYMPGYGWGMAMGATGAGRIVVDNGTLDALTGPITISFWYRRTGTIASISHLVGCGSAGSATGFVVAVAITNNNNLAYMPGVNTVGTLDSNRYVDLGIRPLNTTEHHCITGEGATLKHYVTPVGGSTTVTTWTLSGTQAQPTAHTGTRYFGASNSGTVPAHNLTLADLRIYNRALSAQEVWATYDPRTRFELFKKPQIIPVGLSQTVPTDISRKRISSEYLEVIGLKTSPAQLTRDYLELISSNNLSEADLLYLELIQPFMAAHQLDIAYLETIMEHVAEVQEGNLWVGGHNRRNWARNYGV